MINFDLIANVSFVIKSVIYSGTMQMERYKHVSCRKIILAIHALHIL